MKTIEVQFDIDDSVYTVDGKTYNRENGQYTEWEVNEYKIRSISISCNSKKEWKTSYRAQRVCDGKTIDLGFNFHPDDVGKCVFVTREEAEKIKMNM